MRRKRVIAFASGVLIVAGAVTVPLLLPGASDRPAAATSPPAPEPAAAPIPPPPPSPPRAPVATWPQYGRDAARTAAAGSSRVQPPYSTRWVVSGGSLIEFPPAIEGGNLYFGTNHGRVLSVSARTGRIRWSREYGRCIAASPAVTAGLVYVSVMDPSPCSPNHDPADGFVVALDARTGVERWRAPVGVTESSPLVVGNLLYVGSWDGRLYALDRLTGAIRWSFRTGGKIKGGAAAAGRTIVVGSYDGRVYALDARTGAERWSAADGSSIYANPVIVDGRAVVGDLGGSISAFRLADGQRLWSTRTAGYVYGSGAVWKHAVYVGSYDGRLYALDAATGQIRWTFDAGGPISGSPTVVGGIVYFARCSACVAGQTHLYPRGAFGVDAATGRLVWRNRDGEYTPIVSDGRFAYLVGYSRLYELAPVG